MKALLTNSTEVKRYARIDSEICGIDNLAFKIHSFWFIFKCGIAIRVLQKFFLLLEIKVSTYKTRFRTIQPKSNISYTKQKLFAFRTMVNVELLIPNYHNHISYFYILK